jgi:hypothetical protein
MALALAPPRAAVRAARLTPVEILLGPGRTVAAVVLLLALVLGSLVVSLMVLAVSVVLLLIVVVLVLLLALVLGSLVVSLMVLVAPVGQTLIAAVQMNLLGIAPGSLVVSLMVLVVFVASLLLVDALDSPCARVARAVRAVPLVRALFLERLAKVEAVQFQAVVPAVLHAPQARVLYRAKFARVVHA